MVSKSAAQICNEFIERYQIKPRLFRAPGRINIIGEHTDYNLGYVLPGAIDKALYFAVKPKAGNFSIVASNFNEQVNFTVGEELDKDMPHWAQYLWIATNILAEKNLKFSGIDCVFGGNIPDGAGLSSSAALCCGFIYALNELFGLSLERPEIAKIGQSTEHRLGLSCGLMDQYAVLFGKKGHVFKLDCKTLDFEYYNWNLKEYALFLIDSKVKHQLAAGSAYNDRVEACSRVIDTIKGEKSSNSLRDLSMNELIEHKNLIDAADYEKAVYVLEENLRVLKTIDLINQQDTLSIGEQLFLSHDGLKNKYQVSSSEMDLLVDLAKQNKSVIGARMVGGGFGGCTLNLVEGSNQEAAKEYILKNYKNQTGIEGECYAVDLSDGIREIEPVNT